MSVNQAQSRVQTSIRDFVNEIDKGYLRNMERQMHLCAAECSSNEIATINEVMQCREKCTEKTIPAQNYVQSELQRVSDGLNRCVLSCQDDVKDKMTATVSEAEQVQYTHQFEACAIKCCDTNIERLPTLSKKVLENLRSGKI